MTTPGPMNPLQIQLFTGAAAGRRARFDRSPISFGRDPSNMLVVEDAVVSRRHGEVRFAGGMWVLVNQSENGTKVNRKAVTDRPLPLRSGDEVYVGGKLLFNVTFEPVETTAPGDLPLMADANAAAPPPARKKKKVWIAISAYMGGILLAVIFFSSLGKKPTTQQSRVPELTKETIAELIRASPRREPASELRYRESLTEANRLFDRRDTSPGGLYDAHRMYQTALSYSGRDDHTFPPEAQEAQLKFRQVQHELIEKVELIYRDACNRLNRGDYDGAWRGFDQLKAVYKQANSPLIENIQDKQNVAVRGKGKGKIKVK